MCVWCSGCCCCFGWLVYCRWFGLGLGSCCFSWCVGRYGVWCGCCWLVCLGWSFVVCVYRFIVVFVIVVLGCILC